MRRLSIMLAAFLLFYNPAIASDFLMPLPQGIVHVTFGYESADTHLGEKAKFSLDFQAFEGGRSDINNLAQKCYTIGAPVLASKSGVVKKSSNPVGVNDLKKDYGVVVKIENSDNTATIYGHMIDGSLAVKNGDEVIAGQILGLLGATGNTKTSSPCVWENNIGSESEFRGPHLHFENRDKDNMALKPEPLIGAKNYTGITLGEYTSTTLLYDPTGHWAKYAGKVPYRLTYNPTRIESFSPLIIEGGKEQVFTIKGENLIENLKVTLPGCKGGINWVKREGNEQQFTCVLAKPKQPEIRPGYIEFGAEKIHFKIEVLSDGTIPDPIITKAEVINPIADKMTDFVVKGEHLPGDLKLDMQDCQNTTYKSISSIKQEFACRLPYTVYNETGRRINRTYTFNAQLVSEEMNYYYPLSFSVDYEVMVQKLSPAIAYAGEKTLFTFAGKNINLVKAGWIENCYDLREVERSDEHIAFECSFRSEAEESLMSLLTPNIFKQDKFRILLKDKNNGTSLFDEKISVFYNKIFIQEGSKPTEEKLSSDIDDYGGALPDTAEALSVKNECISNPHLFNENLINAKGNNIIFKNRLLPFKKEGYIGMRDAIGFFVKKNNSDFFNDLDTNFDIPKVSLYRPLIDKFKLQEVPITIKENDVTYSLSLSDMKDRLKNDYCFIELIENNISNSQKGLSVIQNYWNGIR